MNSMKLIKRLAKLYKKKVVEHIIEMFSKYCSHYYKLKWQFTKETDMTILKDSELKRVYQTAFEILSTLEKKILIRNAAFFFNRLNSEKNFYTLFLTLEKIASKKMFRNLARIIKYSYWKSNNKY